MHEEIWVVALNDAEAAEIVRLLLTLGRRVLVSTQGWGANWDGLENEYTEILDAYAGKVYGVELQGTNRWRAIDVDHHRYREDDRWKPESSLEQAADIVGVRLDRWQQLVAANDRGYIPAMEDLRANKEEIAAVRMLDRRMQGVTTSDEQRAREEVKSAEWYGSKALVKCAGKITSAHTDLLYRKAREALLMGIDWEYVGPRHLEMSRYCLRGEHWWSGGTERSGYFGVSKPSRETQRELREAFLHDPVLSAR